MTFFRSLILMATASLFLACTASKTPESSFGGVVNLTRPAEGIYASGQPTELQIRQMAAEGVKHIIDLRPATEERNFQEQELVRALGMNYHNIPVAGAADVTPEKAATLEGLLSSLEGPVLVHCASGNRVGALRAVTAAENGASTDEAVEEGARWGLTGMAPTVREILDR